MNNNGQGYYREISIMANGLKLPENRYEWLKGQINSFAELNDNWDGYNAIPIFEEIINITKSFIVCINDSFIDNVSDIYPNPHGTITIEWEKNENEKLSLEIGINNYSYFVQYPNKPAKLQKGLSIIDDSKILTKDLSELFEYELPKYFLRG